MNLGTVPEWGSVVVNGAVALVALVGLRHARQDARGAEQRAEAAQRKLAEDRLRRAAAGLARVDLANVTIVLKHHETLLPNVHPRPIDTGEIRTALAALPAGIIPKARERYAEESETRPSRDEVTEELYATVRQLRTESAADA